MDYRNLGQAMKGAYLRALRFDHLDMGVHYWGPIAVCASCLTWLCLGVVKDPWGKLAHFGLIEQYQVLVGLD